MSGPVEWQAAGVYDPSADDADEVRALLEWLTELGVGVDEIAAANTRGRLVTLAADRDLRPGQRFSARQIADEVDLPVELIRSLHRASGVPPIGIDEPVYSSGDVEMFGLFATAAQFFSDDELVHFTRVMGSALRRIAEAASEMFLRDVEVPLQSDGQPPLLALAQAAANGMALARTATAVFDPMFRLHLEQAILTQRRARPDGGSFETVPLAIGFVDLNGFTTRSGELEPGDLLQLVRQLEARSIDLVAGHGGRLVKLIGDEVMFATVEPAEACAIAEALVREADSWASGGRAGVAHGEVILSGGDIYGTPVNLAARIVDIAVPGEVLVDTAVRDGAPDLTFAPAGRRQLKGFPAPVRLWSLGD